MPGFGQMFGRKKGEDAWYSPDRDILQVLPSCLVRGAAYAADPNSSIFSWITQQDGINKENAVTEIRVGISELLNILDETRSNALSDALTTDRIKWPVLQAIMFGVGIVTLNTYNQKFREARFTDLSNRSVQEPTPHVDKEHAMHIFDELVNRAGEK